MDPLAEGIAEHHRPSLARAITLVESSRLDHRQRAATIIDELRPLGRTSLRVGISGTPGVGKSTFIEAVGSTVIGSGARLAVLAIDPSSAATGGSILGDKTRMASLAQRTEAFIRPSPTSGVLGGVASKTADAIQLCEAAGFDVVFVETVGVGQSETMVADMSDVFVLLVAPGGGDDLQGIKRGVMELTDIVVVNKADGDNRDAALRTANDYRNALHMVRPKRSDLPTLVVTSTSQEPSAVASVWDEIVEFHRRLSELGHLRSERRRQHQQALNREIDRLTLAELAGDPALAYVRRQLEERVASGELASSRAALNYLSVLQTRLTPESHS